MGWHREHTIVVTAFYDNHDCNHEHWIETAYRKAAELFKDITYVSPPSPKGMNGVRSFFVAPDGSKEGWGLSDEGNSARKQFVKWLEDQAYDDLSSPLTWVEVQFGDDALKTKIINDSDRRQRRANR